jgi:hypothetical protein
VAEWQEWDGEAVMNGDLPTLPETDPPPGVWVPLARWWKPTGATGFLLIVMLDPELDDGAPYKADIDSFARDKSGMWRWLGGGGSDWRFGWEPRPPGGAYSFEGMGSGGPDEIFVAPGVAGAEVSAILVQGDTWSTECPVEPRTGAFLAGAGTYEQVEITALDDLGKPLHSAWATTLWDAVHAQSK